MASKTTFELNKEQTRVMDFILKGNLSNVMLCVCGEAGTGKSTLLNAIVGELRRSFGRERVLVVAPTGVSACNVAGNTVHSAFGIPVRGKLRKPTAEVFDRLRNVQWIICDEMSTLSASLLEALHDTLTAIRKITKPFAGCNLILFGDLLQLRPVGGRWIFQSPLWKNFTFAILTKNERHVDLLYRELCTRIRIGEMLESDATALQTRELSQLSTAERQGFKHAVHVFARRKESNAVNDFYTKQLQEAKVFTATDRLRKKTGVVGARRKATAVGGSYSTRDVRGIPFTLVLGPGSRVMLRHNVSVDEGLVNGRTGTVIEATATLLKIRFDASIGFQESSVHCLKKVTLDVALNADSTLCRHQFPVMLAWAVNAHKVLGLTMTKAILYAENFFCAGLAYTMISRVRTLNDLCFATLDCNAIKRNRPDKRAISEYRRILPLSITKHPNDVQIS